jgi:hypothetical protein
MTIHLPFNSKTPGGAIRATIQQLLKTGLGLLWSDTLGDWTTAATTFNDRTFPVVEQDVGDNAIAYYGQAVFDNESFTGTIIKGYHDTAALPVANILLYSEIGYVRRGEEIDFVIADDRANMDVSQIFTFQVSKRTDGTYAAPAGKEITISPLDDIDFTYDLPKLFPSGTFISQINTVEVSPTGTLVIDKVGPQGLYPILSTSGGQVAGTDYTVSCVALLNTAVQVKCQGILRCVT